MGTRIAPEDLTWLLMDQPHNLMHVNGLIGFDDAPDLDGFTEIVAERMVRKYRVLSQLAVQRDGEWMWEDDPDFDIRQHVSAVVLDDASDEAVRAHVANMFSQPFDRSRPLWEMQILTGPDPDDTRGYVYSRFHHGIADGIRLVQLVLGLCDPADDATPPAVGRNASGEHHHPLDRVRHVVEHTIADAADYVGHAREAVASKARDLMSTTRPLSERLHDASELVRHPVKLVDALTGIASVDNEVANSWRELSHMLLSDGHEAEAWSGHTGVEKSIAWLEGYPLDGLRAAAHGSDASLNDILLASVSLALTDYLAERGVDDVTDLSWMMPVSLQPVDASLPDRLGNHFVVVMLSMPLGLRDPRELVEEIHQRTTRLKHSVEPMVAFGVQRALAESPTTVARRITEFFAGRTIGQLSNVPGPRVPMELAGRPVRSILGWVPTSGDQPLGVCLFSYAGTVNVGVATDARMIPDPAHFVELIRARLDDLATLEHEAAH